VSSNPKYDYLSLSDKDLNTLQDIWLRAFHAEHADGKKENTTRWFRSVVEFIGKNGDEIVPASLLKDEADIVTRGLAGEYLATLRELTAPSTSLSQEAQAVQILMAAPEVRMAAVRKVLKGDGK
jgi:hypothetical protein